MGSRLSSCFALSAFATFASAQNVTVPASLVGVEGGGGTNVPFGSSQSCRLQVIYDAEELPWSGPRVITGILLRADNNTPNTAIAAKGFLDVTVLVSTTDKTAATASATFAANHGTDVTTVINHQMIQLPAQPPLPAGPRPANIPFVFQVPWAYGLTPATGSLPAPRNLLIEIHIHSQPNGLYRVDNLGSCDATRVPYGTQGAACSVPGSPPPVLTSDVSMQAGYPYSWRVEHGAPSLPFLVSLNVTNQGGLFGNPAWPLPYPMFDPQNPQLPSPALAPLLWPAPDCWLFLDPLMFLGGLTDATGQGIVTSTLPAGRNLVGQTFHAQALLMSPTSNPLRFIASNGLGSTICGPLGVTRIHAFYNGTGNPPAAVPTTGQVLAGNGFVLEVM